MNIRKRILNKTSNERKSRMPLIPGIKGEAVPPTAGLGVIDNEDAVGVRSKAMGYHRLSLRVNKMMK
jgi:hypothetical protein